MIAKERVGAGDLDIADPGFIEDFLGHFRPGPAAAGANPGIAIECRADPGLGNQGDHHGKDNEQVGCSRRQHGQDGCLGKNSQVHFRIR